MNIYTGAGVGAIDVNNDGLTDLFFAGNQTPCKLYLNKGNFEFQDITPEAGIKTEKWMQVKFVNRQYIGIEDIKIFNFSKILKLFSYY